MESIRAVITGAGSGLGQALCLELAKSRAKIIVADIDEERAAETVSLVEKEGGEAKAMRCDVAVAEQVEALAIAAEEAWGGTDFLANNAGVPVAGAIGDIPLEDWHWILDINLRGVIYGCHFFAPRMKAQKSGMILNVASAAGLLSPGNAGPYNVSKAGVVALSETLSQELVSHGVKVSVLCPVFFKTNLLDNMRCTDPAHLAGAQREFDRARWNVTQVAQYTLRRVEKGKLYILPQSEARWIWRVKRLVPEFFTKVLLPKRIGRSESD